MYVMLAGVRMNGTIVIGNPLAPLRNHSPCTNLILVSQQSRLKILVS
jgi:hypothetical protein